METRSKVLFLITKSNWGGAQRYVYDMALGLQKTHEVTVAAGGNGVLFEKLQAAGVRTISVPSLVRDINFRNDTNAYKEIIGIIRREKPDILHLNSSKAGMLGARAGRYTKVPRIVFTAHGWAFNDPESSFLSRLVSRFLHWITIIQSDATIAVSHAVYRGMASLPGMRSKMQVIHLGIHPRTDAAFSRKHLRTRANISSEPSHILGAISELHPVKGLTYFIESMRIIRENYPAAVAVIFGTGHIESDLRSEIESKNLTDAVLLCGFDADAYRYLNAMDVFVQPSLSEALGYSLLEAGSEGIAAVASNVGGMVEIIENEVTGLIVPPRDAQALATAIASLCADAEKRSQLGSALQEKIRDQFSFERMLTATVDLYTH